MTRRTGPDTLQVSVVVATYNRTPSAVRLLAQLAEQTLAPERFEVIVVDDGSAEPAEPQLAARPQPYALKIVTQANAGPAAARHRGLLEARAELVVIVDDDMRVGPGFLAGHLSAHAAGETLVVLGRLRADPSSELRLFERLQIDLLDRLGDDVRAGRARLHGSHLYTGNVSLRRADYLAVGGFDPSFRLSEDAELGVRLEAAGATFAITDAATAMHASDHPSLDGWVRRSVAYGAADARIAAKHPDVRSADPWRFIFLVNRVSRPLLLAGALAPALMRPVAWLAMRVALTLAWLGAERAALAGATLVYGIHYFQGVRRQAGSRGGALRGLARHLNGCDGPELRAIARFAKMAADIGADHEAVRRADAKYKPAARRSRLAVDLVQRVGFQMMAAYRIMRFLRDVGRLFAAKIASRAIRHLYGADLHWDAELAPGVMIVHGAGLVVSHAARVGPGCVLFQHVTLGESIHPETREVGAPTLEANVHVGPGATLLGPITVGRDTKVMATAVMMASVPPRSLVEVPLALVRPRATPPAPAGMRPTPAGVRNGYGAGAPVAEVGE